VRGPRSLDQFLAIDPDLSQAIRHMSDLPVATVVKAAKALLLDVKAAREAAAVAELEPEVAVELEAEAEPEAFEPEIILPAARLTEEAEVEVSVAEHELAEPKIEADRT
jgi:hypothetical protein